jgi:hypothetical protein
LPWLLLLEEYEVIFEYFPGNKQKIVSTVADALSHNDIDSLKIQEEIEEALKLLSGSENFGHPSLKITYHVRYDLKGPWYLKFSSP